jgi:signal peptidase I
MTAMRPADDLAAQVLRRGRPLRIKARGVSMLPFLRDGDVTFVMPAAGTEIGVGDVICYEMPPAGLFLHRVIERTRDRFVTKGDALRFTEVVDPGHILGKVVAVQRRGHVKRLDTRIARWRNRAIAVVSPLVPSLVSLAVPVRRIARAARAWGS